MKQKIEIAYKNIGPGRTHLEPIAIARMDKEIVILSKYYHESFFSGCSIDPVQLDITVDLPDVNEDLHVSHIVIASDEDYERLERYENDLLKNITRVASDTDPLVEDFKIMHNVYAIKFSIDDYFPEHRRRTVEKENDIQEEKISSQSYSYDPKTIAIGTALVGFFAATIYALPTVVNTATDFVFKR